MKFFRRIVLVVFRPLIYLIKKIIYIVLNFLYRNKPIFSFLGIPLFSSFESKKYFVVKIKDIDTSLHFIEMKKFDRFLIKIPKNATINSSKIDYVCDDKTTSYILSSYFLTINGPSAMYLLGFVARDSFACVVENVLCSSHQFIFEHDGAKIQNKICGLQMLFQDCKLLFLDHVYVDRKESTLFEKRDATLSVWDENDNLLDILY